MSKRKHEEGICPVCGDNKITYVQREHFDTQTTYDWHCDKCQSTGTEVMSLHFDRHEIRYNSKTGETAGDI